MYNTVGKVFSKCILRYIKSPKISKILVGKPKYKFVVVWWLQLGWSKEPQWENNRGAMFSTSETWYQNYRLLCHLLTSICYGCAPSQHCMKDCQQNPYSIICSNSTTNSQEQSTYGTIELKALQRVGPTNCKNTTPRNKSKMICSTLDQEDKLGQYSTNRGLRM